MDGRVAAGTTTLHVLLCKERDLTSPGVCPVFSCGGFDVSWKEQQRGGRGSRRRGPANVALK